MRVSAKNLNKYNKTKEENAKLKLNIINNEIAKQNSSYNRFDNKYKSIKSCLNNSNSIDINNNNYYNDNYNQEINSNSKESKLSSSIFNKDNKLLCTINNIKKFDISKRQISDLFEVYESRKFDEEIVKLQLMGGTERLCELLDSSPNNGINNANSISLRIKDFDSNIIIEEKPKSFFGHLLDAFDDIMLRILIISAIIQIGFGVSPLSAHPERDWIDGISILIAVFIVVFVSSITDFLKQKKFLELKEKNMNMVLYTVKREGKLITIKGSDLVVGDLLKIQIGCNIPADGILIEGNGLKLNESSLTGETDLIEKEPQSICIKIRDVERNKNMLKLQSTYSKKNNNINNDLLISDNNNNKSKIPSPLIWSGTSVELGNGWMMILAVGKNSSNGKIMNTVLANKLNSDNKTPLEIKLNKLGKLIGKLGILFALLTCIALIIRFVIVYLDQKTNYDNGVSMLNPNSTIANNIIKIIVLTISILVVAIPEGLPLAVTLSLAFSVQKMMEDKNLVRQLSGCETMGNANYICTDKTGTLTKNVMTVHSIFNCIKSINVSDICSKENYIIDSKDFFNNELDYNVKENSEYNRFNNNRLNKKSIDEHSENSNFNSVYNLSIKKNNIKGKTNIEYRNTISPTPLIKNSSNYESNRILLDNNNNNNNNEDIYNNIKYTESINNKEKNNYNIIDKSNENKMFVNLSSNNWFNELSLSIALNLELEIDENEIIKNESKTDLSLVKFLHNFNVKIYPIVKEYIILDTFKQLPFSSSRKKKSILIKSNKFPTGYRLYIKGASENLISSSVKYYLCPSSLEIKYFSLIKNLSENIINSYARETLRTICIAYKDISEDEFLNYKDTNSNGSYKIEEDNLIMISILGIKDTLRENVEDAVIKCRAAGINVVMITGDNIETALSISKKCSIVRDEDINLAYNNCADSENLSEIQVGLAMNGIDFYEKIEGLECGTCYSIINDCKCPLTSKEAEFRGIDKNVLRKERIKNLPAFSKILQNLKVLARSRPIDKYAMVIGLKALDNIVAVTGDGTNDAQALSTSDIGFAMGILGTDIAKDAADIIILDDNFESIVKAVVWGRNIYDNIRKFVQFQLTVNLCACFLVFITSIVSNETAISPIQMLWINLIIDSLGSLALSTQKPNNKILLRKPFKKHDSLISIVMWKHIIFQAFSLLVLTLIVFFYGPSFIIEGNINRIKQGEIIKKCFETVPGEYLHPVIYKKYGQNSLDDYLNYSDNISYYILSGKTSDWSTEVTISKLVYPFECGAYYQAGELSAAFYLYKNAYSNTTHMTIVFNIFVLYTLFNQINSRVIDEEFNIFTKILQNSMFIIVIFLELILHIIIIQFGSTAFNTAKEGLTLNQWLLCFGFGVISFFVSFILKISKLEIMFSYILNCFKKNLKSKVHNDSIKNRISLQIKENEEKIRKYTASIQYLNKTIRKSIRRKNSCDMPYEIKQTLKKKDNYIEF